ncbi:MAG: matrixin family metalloprotease [Actinomycetota bacterium]
MPANGMLNSLATDLLMGRPSLRNEMEKGLYELLKSRLQKVRIDGETFYVAEGDTLLDSDQLFIYAQQREAFERQKRAEITANSAGLGMARLVGVTSNGERGLMGVVQGGRIVRWPPGFKLTYTVLKATFTAAGQYDTVVSAMAAAAKAWEEACGVAFERLEELDESPTVSPEGVLFTVRFLDAGGAFIASAFFPNDPPARRRVLIDPSFFSESLTFDTTGVLRHELGHVLGFRHEHIRTGAPPDCPDEETGDSIDLTRYDPKSVMHYFCGDLGSKTLEITELDKEGAQKVYGMPLDSFAFVPV